MASRPHGAYMRLLGLVDGTEVRVVVRDGGGVVGDPPLLRRGELLVAMGEEFEAPRVRADMGEDPLSTSLTLIRGCDQVTAVELAVLATPATRPADRR